MDLIRHTSDDPSLPAILALIQRSFAYIEGIIDPPSSVHRLSLSTLNGHATKDELWSIGAPPQACMILSQKPDALYIGKLCVSDALRSQGIARRLIDHAAQRAKALNLPALELQTRIELIANHAAFMAMGFIEFTRTTHAGYSKPTSITFRKNLTR